MRSDRLSVPSHPTRQERNVALPFISIWAGISLRIARRAITGDWKRARAVWAGVRRAEIAP